MKKLSALFLMILVLISCQKDNSTEIVLTGDYFPLKVGNYWDYELAGRYLVKDTKMVDGKEYFEILDDYGTSSFYTVRDNKIYVRNYSINNNEELKFDLTAQTDETWTYGPGKVRLADRYATITIGNVQVDSCLQFIFYNNDLIDYGSTSWLAPGIGLIQIICQECYGSGFEIIKLNKVNINNKVVEFEKK